MAPCCLPLPHQHTENVLSQRRLQCRGVNSDTIAKELSMGGLQLITTSAGGYVRVIRSERRSRTHPVLLQKIYEGAHLWQKQAGARG